VPAILILLTIVAAAAPAWRASRIDPAKVLNG
jgi:ABC-type lipoprotein release transport system permease subunit